jgi:hypothetical protein
MGQKRQGSKRANQVSTTAVSGRLLGSISERTSHRYGPSRGALEDALAEIRAGVSASAVTAFELLGADSKISTLISCGVRWKRLALSS